MANKYASTLLAQSGDPLEIQKADLDLLKKINEVNDLIGSATPATVILDKVVISGQIGPAATDPVAPQKIPFGEFWTKQGVNYDPITRRFNILSDGIYRVTMNPFVKAGTAATRVLVGVNNDAPNPTTHRGAAYQGTSTYDTLCIDSVIALNKGDYLVFYLTEGALYNSPGADLFNQFSIEKMSNLESSGTNIIISDPNNIVVRVEYYNQLANSINLPVNYQTKRVDTHSAVTTGAAWKFTCPVTGSYIVTCTTYCGGTLSNIILYKNGVSYAPIGNCPPAGIYGIGATTIDLVVGEYIDVRPTSASVNETSANISIAKI